MREIKWSKQEESSINDYMEYELEELEGMLEYPQNIETGCKRNCDTCKDYELDIIREAYKRKKLAEQK